MHTDHMGRKALAAYLTTLRDGRGMSRNEFVRRIPSELKGSSPETIGRYERGESMPGADMLAIMLHLVDGDPKEALDLAANADATELEGKLLAMRRMDLKPENIVIEPGTTWYLVDSTTNAINEPRDSYHEMSLDEARAEFRRIAHLPTDEEKLAALQAFSPEALELIAALARYANRRALDQVLHLQPELSGEQSQEAQRE